jgi:Zn-dependent oligopeptidase
LLERTRNGLHLPEERREKFNQLKNQINNKAIDFQKNLNQETGKIWFTTEVNNIPFQNNNNNNNNTNVIPLSWYVGT